MTLVLASASPRRRDLLSRLNIPFEVRPVDIAEDVPDGLRPEIAARKLARTKAEAARLLDSEAPILAADTIVSLDGRILGKPRDAGEAREMLSALRNREHEVISGVAFLPEGERAVLARQPVTAVRMRDYSDAEIDASISRGDPFDKAGAYAIQDTAFDPVASYMGCYCNVVGLSLWATVEIMRKAGVKLEVSVEQLLPQCVDCPQRLA